MSGILGEGLLGDFILGESSNLTYGQAQASILQTYARFAQSQADILQTYLNFAQAQATVATRYSQYSQAQATILSSPYGFAQAQADINQTYFGFSQAQGRLGTSPTVYAQARAFICWTDTFTRTTSPATGIGSDYTWQVWDSYWSSLAQSTTYVDGTRIVIAEQIYDSYSINRTIPLAGSVQFDFYVPFFVDTIHDSQWRRPTYGVQFGANWATGARTLYVGTTFNPTNDNAWLIGSINGDLVNNGNGVEFSPDENTMYTAKLVYNELGDVAFKVWKTSDAEPVDYLFRDSVVGFVSYNTAWIDLFYGPFANNGFVDNLIFCYEPFPPPLLEGHGNAQAQIITTDNNRFGQAQTKITNTTPNAQAQASIKQFYQGYGQAQAKLLTARIFGQAQANIYNPYRWANAQGHIVTTNINNFGQAQSLLNTGFGLGQAQAYISSIRVSQVVAETLGTSTSTSARVSQLVVEVLLPTVPTARRSGQAQGYIGTHFFAQGQAQAFILKITGFAQAQAKINSYNNPVYAQALATILATVNKYGQSNADIKRTSNKFGQAQALIIRVVFAQAQGTIKKKTRGYGQAQARILATSNKFGQAQGTTLFIGVAQATVFIFRPTFIYRVFGAANALIRPRNKGFALAQATVERVIKQIGLAQARIGDRVGHGNARARITGVINAPAQAQAFMSRFNQYGHAQGYINSFDYNRYGQAQGKINSFDYNQYGQALATLATRWWQGGQALANIHKEYWTFGQALAVISRASQSGQARAAIVPNTSIQLIAQAQAQIVGYYYGSGNAKASIERTIKSGLAQGYILQTRAGGLVRYGSMILPGYYNSESMDSPLRIMINNIAYDANLMEITGLENKHISITMQVIDETYIKAKEKVLLAGTMLRSNRSDYEKLTLINPDRYYLVKPSKIAMQQTAGRNENSTSYQVDFECRPWLYGYETHRLSGTTTLDTNSVGRTFLNGTWTPARITLTGTNITVSGYTPTGGFTGYVSVSGSVTNLVIDSDLFSTDMSAQNMDPIMNIDYRLSIGPGRTLFDVNGATECTIEYQDRWAL